VEKGRKKRKRSEKVEDRGEGRNLETGRRIGED